MTERDKKQPSSEASAPGDLSPTNGSDAGCDGIRALAELMSELSEECYCAGWLIGTEFVLWSAVVNGPREWGCGEITDVDIARLKRTSDRIGGWVAWQHDDDPWKSGERFVPMAEWLERFAKIAAEYAPDRASRGET